MELSTRRSRHEPEFWANLLQHCGVVKQPAFLHELSLVGCGLIAAWSLLLVLAAGCSGTPTAETPVKSIGGSAAVATPVAAVGLADLVLAEVLLHDASDGSSENKRFASMAEGLVVEIFKRAEGLLRFDAGRTPADGGFVARVRVLYVSNGDQQPQVEGGGLYAAAEVELERSRSGEVSERYQSDQRREAPSSPETKPHAALETLLRQALEACRSELEARIRAAYMTDKELLEWLRTPPELEFTVLLQEVRERRLTAALDELLSSLAHPKRASARTEIVITLGSLGDERALPELAKLTAADERELLMATVNAIARIGGAEGRRYLESIANGHASPLLRARAKELLAGLRR